MIGSTTCDARAASMYTVFRATLSSSPLPSGAPLLGLTSKWGKLLDDTSSRIRWPRLNRLEVGKAVTLMAYTSPGAIKAGSDQDWRYRHRRIPSVTFNA